MVKKKKEEKEKKFTLGSKFTVRKLIKDEPRATLTIKAAPNRSYHFKEEFEAEGNLLGWK